MALSYSMKIAPMVGQSAVTLHEPESDLMFERQLRRQAANCSGGHEYIANTRCPLPASNIPDRTTRKPIDPKCLFAARPCPCKGTAPNTQDKERRTQYRGRKPPSFSADSGTKRS
jgi:hypothetical protein